MYRTFLLLLLALIICPNAFAQGTNYNYRYGDSRIIIQSQTGLTYPSSTYIGPGTFSKSAQGIPENGAQANPGLPKVNAGGFIGTPGDNLYGDNPIRAVQPKRMVRQPVRIIYVQPPQQQQPRQPKEYTYVPGQNAPMEYGSSGTDTGVHLDSSGAAAYGSSDKHY